MISPVQQKVVSRFNQELCLNCRLLFKLVRAVSRVTRLDSAKTRLNSPMSRL